MIVLACALIALACGVQAATAGQESWVGVWQAKVENKPGMTLTLASDTGELGGTIVFEAFDRMESRLVARDPHTLMHAHLDGKVLSFQVNGCCGKSGIFNMTAEFTTEGKLRIRCANCGSDAVTELEKL
jgi:hypothetical protein